MALSEKKISDRVLKEIRLSFLDYLACTAAGSTVWKKERESCLGFFSDPHGKVPVVGTGRRTDPLTAAMVNGISSHTMELDDGHRYAMLHPGAPVFSAMLSVAYDRKTGYEDFVRGILIGYESTIRLAGAIQPGHKLKGFHATGTCGTIGAAMGISAALGFDRDQWMSAVSAAATDAAGLLQVMDDGSELKPYNVGHAAVSAINAACLGYTGLKGPSDVLGGKRGFFAIAADQVNESFLLEGFQPRSGIETVYRKPYAACRHSHAAIEAALNIRSKYGFEADDCREIEVLTYGLAVRGHDHTEVTNAGDAKMSIPYAVACALLYGSVNVQEYSRERLEDKDLKRLMKKIRVTEDPELSAMVPEKRAAIVKVCGSGGAAYEDRVDYPLGEPENRLSDEQMRNKYDSLMAAAGTDRDLSSALRDAVCSLETNYENVLTMICEL